MDTQAVILAGGQGTRLRPLTLARPKPIVPLSNRPFLEYQLALLRQHGVTDVVLACSYRVEDIAREMGAGGRLGVSLSYAIEAEPLGTAGGLRNAVGPGERRVIVLNGDCLTDVDLSAMILFHEARGSRTTIYLTSVPDPTRYGVVEAAADGALRGFVEKPHARAVTTDMINAGIYILEPEVLRRIPTGRPVSIERETFPGLLADGLPCFGFVAPGYWRDIGNVEAYRQAQIDLLEGRVATSLSPPGSPRDGCWIAADARIEAGASVRGPAVVGSGVSAGAGVRIGPFAVVGEGARIHPGARVEGALLWERVDVGPHATLRDCVIGADVRIGAHAEAGPGVVIASATVVPDHARLSA